LETGGLKRKTEIQKGVEVNDFRDQKAWGYAFFNSEYKCIWIFWNHPICIVRQNTLTIFLQYKYHPTKGSVKMAKYKIPLQQCLQLINIAV